MVAIARRRGVKVSTVSGVGRLSEVRAGVLALSLPALAAAPFEETNPDAGSPVVVDEPPDAGAFIDAGTFTDAGATVDPDGGSSGEPPQDAGVPPPPGQPGMACSAAAPCATGIPCGASGLCLAKLATLRDDFTTLDAGTWDIRYSNGDPATVTATNGQLHLRSLTQPGMSQLQSAGTFDFKDSSATIELISAGRQSINSLQTWISVRADQFNYVAMHVHHNNLRPARVVGDMYDDYIEVPYNATAMRWLRIRESSGRTYFEYSANGQSFTVLTSATNPINVREVRLMLESGTGANETQVSTAIYDNVNLP